RGAPARNPPDPSRALEPDAIVGQQLLVLADLLRHDGAELEDLLVPSNRDVEREAPDAHRVVREPRAAIFLEQIENELALAERVEEHRHGADVHRVRADPQTMAGDPLELADRGTDVSGAARDLDLHQLLDGLAVA